MRGSARATVSFNSPISELRSVGLEAGLVVLLTAGDDQPTATLVTTVSAGQALVDALALVTPSHLDQQFLVVGAQLPEPTVNVTAAVWRGASSRGREVPNTPSSFDPDAFTRERATGGTSRMGRGQARRVRSRT